MKYMSFNNSCSYAGIANMLEDFSIDIEDFQLALEMKASYIFKFDDNVNRYISGSMLQENKYFNYYLHKKNLSLVENSVNKEYIAAFLNTLDRKAMIGLNISKGYRHAVIYLGYENNEYIFLNNIRRNTNEPKFYKHSIDELKIRLDEASIISYIEKNCEAQEFDIKKEIENSIVYLEKYKNEVENFCQIEQSLEFIHSTMNTHFRAIFLDVYSMMEIIKEAELVNKIGNIRNEYLKAIKINKPLKLSDYISIEEFKDIIELYKKVIQLELENEENNIYNI